jgi:5'-nucleotidase
MNLALRGAAVLTVLSIPATSAFALNILLCNDDGVTAANVRALKQQLVAAGHSAIVASPIDNQSGTGGFIRFLQPIPALTGNERGAKALQLPKDSPGVGTDQSDADAHYVNGTPATACLYGIDVLASKRWGGAPDLVISGPNEGNNTGHINNSSGTFNAMLYAVNRRLPAIAVSDAVTTLVTWSPALPANSRAFEVANIVVRLVDTLWTQGRHRREPLLPEGLGLNVNVPSFPAGAGMSLPWQITQVGFATAYAPAFFERLSDSPLAVGVGVNVPMPGISLATAGTVLPSGVVIPTDSSSNSEGNAVATGTAVTVSPVQGVPEASGAAIGRLRGLLAPSR